VIDEVTGPVPSSGRCSGIGRGRGKRKIGDGDDLAGLGQV